MNSDDSRSNQQDAEMECPEDTTSSGDFDENLQSVIKTEEVHIFSEFPEEDVPAVFRCYLCSSQPQLESRQDLEEHLETAHPEQPKYQCSKCNRVARSKVAFNSHLARHDPRIRPHGCSICTLRFTSQGTRERHEETAHFSMSNRKNIEYPCPTCGFKLRGLMSLKQHEFKVHKIKHAHRICELCKNISFSEQRYQMHQQDRHDKEITTFQCYSCPTETILDSKTGLEHHLAIAHPEQEKYSCVYCSFTATNIWLLNKHLFCSHIYKTAAELTESNVDVEDANKTKEVRKSTAHGIKDVETLAEIPHSDDNLIRNTYKCYLCVPAKHWKNKDYLLQHLRASHLKAESYHCAQCNEIFDKKRTFNYHLSKHDDQLRPYKCSLCTLRFASMNSKKQHEGRIHQVQNGWVKKPIRYCSVCGKNYGEANFDRHVCKKRVSTVKRKRELTCPICKLECATKERLLKHKLTEHNIREETSEQDAEQKAELIICPVCTIEFPNEDELRKHKRAEHDYKVLYKCYVCEPVTLMDNRKSLKAHLQTSHTPQEIYRCGECNKYLQRISAYNTHMEQHDSSVRPYQCSICEMRFTKLENRKRHESQIHQVRNGIIKRDHAMRKVCPFCKKWIPFEQFAQHVQTEHPNGKHRCSKCEKEFYRKDALEQHEATAHSQKKEKVSKHVKQPTTTEFSIYDNLPEQGKDSRQSTKGTSYSLRTSRRKPNYRDVEDPDVDQKQEQPSEHNSESSNSNKDIPASRKLVKCYLCRTPVVLESKFALKQHLNDVHYPRTVYNCNECDYTTKIKLNFNNHHSKHDPSLRPFKCSVCPLWLHTAERKIYHEAAEHNLYEGTKFHHCTVCGRKFQYESRLRRHLRNTGHAAPDGLKEIPKTPEPESAPEPVPTPEPIRDPIPQPAPRSTVKCSVMIPRLSIDLSALKSVTSAITSSASDHRKTFKCYICTPQQQLDSKDSLAEHLKTSHPDDEQYNCDECSLVYRESRYYNVHLARHDTSLRRYKCKICPLRFLTAGYRRKHEATVHLIENGMVRAKQQEARRNCRKCRKTIPAVKWDQHVCNVQSRNVRNNQPADESNSLTEHTVSSKTRIKKALIENVKVMVCYLCNKNVVGFNKTLRLHMETFHASMVYRCAKCKYFTRKKFAFNSHCARHDRKKRQFRCKSCSLRFLTAKFRALHELCVHKSKSNRRTHSCAVCDKKFNYKYKLKLHEKVASQCCRSIQGS